MNKKKTFLQAVSGLAIAILLTGCSQSSSSESSNVVSETLDFFSDSANVSSVKNGSITSCPSATLGEMADAFMSGPSWTDFPSTSGGTVVELSGEISFDGAPVEALIQFNLSGSNFEAAYLGINGVDQSLIILSTLLRKMCDATY